MIRTIILVLLVAWVTCMRASAADTPLRVLVWDEQQPEQKQAYGDKFLGLQTFVWVG